MSILLILLISMICDFFFFFFKQKTAYELRISDWSSDVCSSDLRCISMLGSVRRGAGSIWMNSTCCALGPLRARDEERRPQDVMALVRQKQIRGAYAEAAVALARTGEADDQALSDEIEGFLAAMPTGGPRRQLGREPCRERGGEYV